MFYLTIVFLYEYARGRYALNGRVMFSGLAYLVFPFPVSRATGSCTHTFPFPFHMFSYLYECGLTTCLWLPVLYLFSPLVLSTRTITFLAYAFLCLARRLVSMLTFTTDAFSYCSLSTRLSSRYS